MNQVERARCTAFVGMRRVAAGSLAEVATAIRPIVEAGESGPVLIFDDATGEQVEVDWRGTADEVRARLMAGTPAEAPRGPGRPKLGVVAREVTLLPRHWEWLGAQPSGASVALRKLVDEARHAGEGQDRVRRAKEGAYRFLSAMGGNLPGFEEANRALFAGDASRFAAETEAWPTDVRDHARTLASAAFVPLDAA
ncbi:DUF2239 family protein [Tundrisphaera sp. TA3]|uniref:DUF2239 family protein n=1 Tax=Tundrisphaera sp. TA3 TaxID=3435775 RepID=UPI003EBCF4BD